MHDSYCLYSLSHSAMVEISVMLISTILRCDIILFLLLFLYMFNIFLYVYGPCVCNKDILLYYYYFTFLYMRYARSNLVCDQYHTKILHNVHRHTISNKVGPPCSRPYYSRQTVVIPAHRYFNGTIYKLELKLSSSKHIYSKANHKIEENS